MKKKIGMTTIVHKRKIGSITLEKKNGKHNRARKIDWKDHNGPNRKTGMTTIVHDRKNAKIKVGHKRKT